MTNLSLFINSGCKSTYFFWNNKYFVFFFSKKYRLLFIICLLPFAIFLLSLRAKLSFLLK